MPAALSPEMLGKMDAYWRAANYLTVGQIYLHDNPLLESPLKIEHIKPRLLGHWGTTTGLNFIYVHLNRLIREHDLNMIYVIGPGHGAVRAWWRIAISKAPTRSAIRTSSAAGTDCNVFFASSRGLMAHPKPCGAGNSRVDP
jgi:hypothetical protein